MGKVQRRVVLCVYGITKEGKGELIDFLLQKSESQESWKSLLEELWKRGLRGAALKLIVTDGNVALVRALSEVWPRAAHQRCWVAQTAQLAKPAQSLAAPLPARSQTHLPSAESTGSDRPL